MSGMNSRVAGGGPLVAQLSPTRTSSRPIATTTAAAAPRPMRRSGSNNTSTLHSHNQSDNNNHHVSNDNVQETGSHRYSSHYFPGEESIVLQYPNQWHDDDTDSNAGEEQQLNAAIDPFPRFPPPPNYPPPHKVAAAAAALANPGVTGTHRSALCRTIDGAATAIVSRREGVDRVGSRGFQCGSGGGGDVMAKIAWNGANKSGTGSSSSVTLNRKLGTEHPDAIDTTSCRIMDATNVINSKTMGGKVSTSSGRRYSHNTLGGGGNGTFAPRPRKHRHSADIDNDDGENKEDDEGDDYGDEHDGGDFDDEYEVGGNGGAYAGDRNRRRRGTSGHRKCEENVGARSSNKLFSGSSSNGREGAREASLIDCRPSSNSSNCNGHHSQTQHRSQHGRSTTKRSGKNGVTADKPNGTHTLQYNGSHANGLGGHSNLDPQVSKW